MVSIHDSVARIYEQTGHADWAARERASGAVRAAGCVEAQGACASFAPAAIVRRSPPRWPARRSGIALLARARRDRARARGIQAARRVARLARAQGSARHAWPAPSAGIPTPSPSSRRRWSLRPAIRRCSTISAPPTTPRATTSRRSPRCRRSSKQMQTTRGCSTLYRRFPAAAAAVRRGGAHAAARRRARSGRPDAAAYARPRPRAEGGFRGGDSADRAACSPAIRMAACTCSSPAPTPAWVRRTGPRRCCSGRRSFSERRRNEARPPRSGRSRRRNNEDNSEVAGRQSLVASQSSVATIDSTNNQRLTTSDD